MPNGASPSTEDKGKEETSESPGIERLLAAVRGRAAAVLSKLDESDVNVDGDDGVSSSASPEDTYRSWVRGEVTLPPNTDTRECDGDGDGDGDGDCNGDGWRPTPRTRYFDSHGFLLVPSFASPSEVSAMREEMKHLAETRWHPGEEKTASFRTDEGQIEAQGSDDYFLDSADRVHFFAEKDALEEEEGEKEGAQDSGGGLKEEFREDKMAALNKAGHGLHILPPPSSFRSYSTHPRLSSLVRELGWTHPVIPQSMYIFKQARVGGEVTSHQDSTFLYTTPRQTCLGLWLALDDATLENGCLWVRPGSHGEGVRRKFARNPEHFGRIATTTTTEESGGCNTCPADKSKPQMLFETFPSEPSSKTVSWEGSLPEGSSALPYDGLFEAGFVPVECRAGDLLAFPGTTDHLSLPNGSGRPRHTFQLHLVEGEKAGMTWDRGNWLQYPHGRDFLAI